MLKSIIFENMDEELPEEKTESTKQTTSQHVDALWGLPRAIGNTGII